MNQGVVRHLRLRAPADYVHRGRARVEDALRLAIPDDRLFVCRHLDMGRLSVSATQSQWTTRAADRMADMRSRAAYAGSPTAGGANAVWFFSVEEARLLLLRELVAGRIPSAWFWRLAVPEWNGATLSVWLPRLLAQAVADPVLLRAVARAVIDAAETGNLAAIVTALAGVAPVWAIPPLTGIVTDVGTNIMLVPVSPAAVATRAHRLLARLTASARRTIVHALQTLPEAHPARAWLARFVVVATAPEVADNDKALVAMAAALLIAAASEHSEADTVSPTDGGARDQPSADPSPLSVEPIQTSGTATREDIRARPQEARAPSDPSPPPAASTIAPVDTSDTTGVVTQEQRSQGVGLFLLVRPLVLMGFPEWLTERPDLAADGFGLTLLRTIATRMRVDSNDPVFAVLGEGPDDPATSAHLTAWRVGLDRWLRRTARVRLADVVRRPGWLLDTGEHLRIRFRVDDADIRLRRRALDIDPGWVPWIGRVVRYHYRDDPMA